MRIRLHTETHAKAANGKRLHLDLAKKCEALRNKKVRDFAHIHRRLSRYGHGLEVDAHNMVQMRHINEVGSTLVASELR